MVEQLFLTVPQGCLWFLIVVFPDHTHFLFLVLAIDQRHKVPGKYLIALFMRGSREGAGNPTPPPSEKITKIYGVLAILAHKATKPTFNVRPSSARQQNAISIVFCSQADDGLVLVVFGSFLLSSKNFIKGGPDNTFWICACFST